MSMYLLLLIYWRINMIFLMTAPIPLAINYFFINITTQFKSCARHKLGIVQ